MAMRFMLAEKGIGMFEVLQSKAGTRERRVDMATVRGASEGKKLAHPAERGPQIFADTAAIDEIAPLYKAGIISGVTTNPSLLKKAGAKSAREARKMCDAILELMAPNPVNLELTHLTEKEMIVQAEELAGWGENVVVKVPVGGYEAVDSSYDPHTGLKVIRALWERDITANATLVFNTTQALWAALAGACYVSPFLGRLADYAYANDQPERTPGNSLYWVEDHRNSNNDQHVFNSEYVASGGARKDIGPRLIQEISAVFTNYDIKTQILAASFRNLVQLTECLLAGADVLTVPAGILQQVADHPLTSSGMATFFKDSQAFEK